MKTGIYIRIGSYNKDLAETTPGELSTWIRMLTREQKENTIIRLVDLIAAQGEPTIDNRVGLIHILTDYAQKLRAKAELLEKQSDRLRATAAIDLAEYLEGAAAEIRGP